MTGGGTGGGGGDDMNWRHDSFSGRCLLLAAVVRGLVLWLPSAVEGVELFVWIMSDLVLDANVVVRELAHLCIVDADDLRLWRTPQPKEGDEMHEPQDDSLLLRHWKSVRGLAITSMWNTGEITEKVPKRSGKTCCKFVMASE